MKLRLNAAAFAGLLLSSTTLAYADDYEVWNFLHKGEEAYAISNMDNGKKALIEVKNGKEAFFQGSAAEAKIKKIKDKMPPVPDVPQISVSEGGKKVFVMKTGSGDGDDVVIDLNKHHDWTEKDGKKSVIIGDTKDISVIVNDGGEEHVIIDLQGKDINTSDVEIDVETLLEDYGIDVEDDGKRSSIIVKKLGNSNEPKVIIKKKEFVTSKEFVEGAPTPPTPPTPPSKTDGEHHSKSKHTYKMTTTDEKDGDKKVFIHMKGLDDDDASDFVDDLEVSKKNRSKLKKAVGL